MHLFQVTGFLGSGKTTFIISMAQQAIRAGLDPAILVNEIGAVGIDDQLMRQLNLDVREILGGCICCSLSADLVTTLNVMDREYKRDMVIVEPSGAAEPKEITKALSYYKGSPIKSIKYISIVDPLRLHELYHIMTPLVTSQIEVAKIVVINKSDLATQEQLQSAYQIVQKINPESEIFRISAIKPLPSTLLESILPCKT